jgi:hypothetical protein
LKRLLRTWLGALLVFVRVSEERRSGREAQRTAVVRPDASVMTVMVQV